MTVRVVGTPRVKMQDRKRVDEDDDGRDDPSKWPDLRRDGIRPKVVHAEPESVGKQEEEERGQLEILMPIHHRTDIELFGSLLRCRRHKG